MARSRKKAPSPPPSSPEPRETAVEAEGARPRAGTRVDPAHVLARPPEPSQPTPSKKQPIQTPPAETPGVVLAELADAPPREPDVLAETATPWSAESPAAVIQQVRTHAEQLARYLRADQQALDHREAQLNAREAELEARTRSARLWFTEQQNNLAEREEAAAAQEQEIEARAGQLGRRQEELTKLEEDVEVRSSQLAAAQFAQEQFEHARFERGSRETRRRPEADRAQQLSIEIQQELDRDREQLDEERRQFEQRMLSERHAVLSLRRAAEDEIAEKEQTLDRRSAHLDERQATLDEFRTEVTRVHRETLEMRVVIEETWSELCQGSLPPKRAEALESARQRLTGQWRLEHQELAAVKSQLESLAARLTQQQEQLAQQKRHFQQWLAGRQEEVERSTTRLVTREEDLRRQQAQLDEAERQWQGERRHLKQEIRRLLIELERKKTAISG